MGWLTMLTLRGLDENDVNVIGTYANLPQCVAGWAASMCGRCTHNQDCFNNDLVH